MVAWKIDEYIIGIVTKCFDLNTGLPRQREFTSYTENFEVLKIMNVKGLWWDTATIFFGFEANFELRTTQ